MPSAMQICYADVLNHAKLLVEVSTDSCNSIDDHQAGGVGSCHSAVRTEPKEETADNTFT